MSAKLVKSELDFSYRWNYVPERLRKLYWHTPLFMYGTALGVILYFSIVMNVAKNLKYGPALAYFILAVILPFIVYWYFRRKSRLEIEALQGLPNGWHLIYKANFSGKYYTPHLVYETEYKKLVNSKKAWWKFDPLGVRTTKNDTFNRKISSRRE